MGPFGVAVGDPSRDQVVDMGQIAKQLLLQDFIPQPAVATFLAEQANALVRESPRWFCYV